MKEERENCIVIGGDFNIRIGEEGGKDIEGWEMKRKSKDKTVGNKGRELINLVGNIGGTILNGPMRGDEEEFTYIGPRGSVIDYVIVNEYCMDIMKFFRIGERVDSSHAPAAEIGGRFRRRE